MKKTKALFVGICLHMIAFNSLSAQSSISEDFAGVADQLIDDSGTGTLINGVKFHGHTAKTVNDVVGAPGTSYQTQVVNEAISVWCEDDSRNVVTWTNEVPDKTVTNVTLELPQDSVLNDFQATLSRPANSGNWWYRIQFSTDDGTTWQLLKGITSNITGGVVNIAELPNSPIAGVDRLRINLWRNGGTDPQALLIDDIVVNSSKAVGRRGQAIMGYHTTVDNT